MTAPQLLRIAEVARRLAISRSAAYRLVTDGALPFVRVGEKSVRVAEEDLIAYVARNREMAA